LKHLDCLSGFEAQKEHQSSLVGALRNNVILF